MTNPTTIQLRRGSAAQAATDNPTLAAGEVGVELDTGRFKIGDGSTAWTALAYATDLSRLPTALQTVASMASGGQIPRRSSRRRQTRYGAAVNAETTLSISTSATISGAAFTSAAPGGVVRAQDAPYRWEGTIPYSPYNSDYVAAQFLNATQPVPWRVSFDFYGDAFEIELFGANYEFLVYIDDQPITDAPATLPNDSNTYWGLVTLPASDHYRVTIELSGGAGAYANYFGGIGAVPAADIRPPVDTHPFRMIVVGDSYCCGKGAGQLGSTLNAYSLLGYLPQLSKLLGVPDTWAMAIGGTGYVADDGGSATPYSARLNDIVAAAPEVVVLQGSVNDAQESGVQAAVTSFIASLQSQLPSVQLITTGPLFAGAYVSGYASVASDIQAAAAAAGVPFVDASDWATGTGYYGATNGSGTSDSYLNGDGEHPTPAGHLMLANRLATALGPLLGLQV